MGKKKKKRKEIVECDTGKCVVMSKVEQFMTSITDVVDKVADNQQTINLSIQKLTDQFEFVEKIDCKVDKLEERVNNNSKVVWKMVGGGVALMIMIPIAWEIYQHLIR